MVLVKTIHNRNANIVVEAHGEVLFAPSGEVGTWTRRFSRKVHGFAEGYAPTNKRPRWGHYGKPLKSTFTSSTRYQPGRMKVYSAVGSTSPHAYYVDQGTGIFNGSGPYQAKILPPWSQGDASLYEHTWIPGGPPGQRVAPVMIKGQKGQGFFDKGLKRGFQFMRMRSFQVPDEGRISKAMGSFPTGLTNFFGNTAATPAFRASLAEWRSWRDAAYARSQALNRTRYDSRAALEASIRATAIASLRRQNAKKAAMSKAARDLAAVKAAAERRAAAQKKALLDQKKIRDKARRDRAERERLTRLSAAHQRARARGQKLKNMDFHVILRPIKNSAGTEIVGYDLLYSDLQGHHHVEHFR